MNLSCVICAELLSPSEDVYATLCGHIFHYICLFQWLERSRTCPQCRNKCSEKNIHKIYFNISNLDASTIDVVSVQHELDAMKLRFTEKDKELTQANNEIHTLKAIRKKCMKTVSGLERELEEKKFLIFSYNEQLKQLQTDNEVVESLRNEIKELKAKNLMMTTVQEVLTSTSAEVENTLKQQSSVEVLVVLVAALKRELEISEKRRNGLIESLKAAQKGLRRGKKQKEILEEKISYLESVNYSLKEKTKTTAVESSSSEVLVNDSAHEEIKSLEKQVNRIKRSEYVSSPNISERIKIIEESNSPYFNIKASSIGLASLLKNCETTKQDSNVDKLTAGSLKKTASDLSDKYSIFKKPRLEVELSKTKPISSNMSFNGIGGSERNIEFSDFERNELDNDVKKKSSIGQRIKSGKLKKLPLSSNKQTLDKFLKKI